MTEMYENQRVEVRLHGDATWFCGVVLDRPRKMWTQLADYYGNPFIADETNIAEWRPLPLPDAPAIGSQSGP